MHKLKKDYDLVIVGKNLASFLVASDTLLHKQDTLWIDDERVGFGSTLSTMTILERDFLREWGQIRNIPPLAKLEDYLDKNPFIIRLKEKEIRLGDAPVRNLLELARKMGGKFYEVHQDLFNLLMSQSDERKRVSDEIIKYSTQLSKKIWNFPEHKELSITLFEEGMPEPLKKVFHSLKVLLFEESTVDADELWNWRHFMLLLRVRFHGRYSLALSDVELFHLLLSMLLPNYRLNQEKLHLELIKFYSAHGGNFVKTTLSECQIDKNRVWSVVLSNYIGTIFPKELLIIGSTQRLKLFQEEDSSHQHYKSLILTYRHPDLLETHSFHNDLIFSSPDRIGTNAPFAFFNRVGEKLSVRYFYEEREGLKILNFKELFDSELREILDHISDLAAEKWELLSVEEGKDAILKASSEYAFKRTNLRGHSKRPKFYDSMLKFNSGSIKDLERISELTEGPLGAISIYHHIRRPVEFV